MKYIISVFLLFLSTIEFAYAQQGKGYLHIKCTSYNFGAFPKKQVRSCVFIVQNTGTTPVAIESAIPTCNCTAVKYSRQPIMPGKKAFITVYYNGKNYAKGKFKKSIDINSTASNGMVRLFISGTTL